jgi:GTP cyclohydrolase II
LQPDGHIIRPDGTYDVHNVVFEQIWHLPGIAERIGVGQTELRKKLFSAFAKGDVHIPLLKDNRFEVWAPNLGEVIISIFGDPAKLADPRVEVACRLHDSCMCGDKDSCRCSCKVTYNQAVEFCLRLAKNGGVGFIAEFLNEGRAMGLVDKHLIYLIREYFGDLPDDYFKSAEFLWGGEKKNDGRLPFVREDVLRLLLGGRRRGSEDKPTIHFLVSESPSKQSAIQGAGFQIGMQIGIDDQMMERRKVNPTEVHAKRKNGYSGNGNGNGHGHLEKTRAQKTESGVVVEDTVSPATRMRCTSASHPMECGCGERPQIVPA